MKPTSNYAEYNSKGPKKKKRRDKTRKNKRVLRAAKRRRGRKAYLSVFKSELCGL